MRVGLDAALLVFRGWLETGASIRIEVRFKAFSVGFEAPIVFAAADEVRFLLGDGRADFVLRFGADFTYSFDDIHTVPTTEPYEEMMLVFFDATRDIREDHIAFARMKTDDED